MTKKAAKVASQAFVAALSDNDTSSGSEEEEPPVKSKTKNKDFTDLCFMADDNNNDTKFDPSEVSPSYNQPSIQAKLPGFDAQGLVDRSRRRSPETTETPGVDEAANEEATSGPAQTGGPGVTSGKPQASSRAAAGSSRRTGGGGTADSGVATALEDRGKRPWLFIPAAYGRCREPGAAGVAEAGASPRAERTRAECTGGARAGKRDGGAGAGGRGGGARAGGRCGGAFGAVRAHPERV
ncbi:uncharacterized protein LOC133898510 [Phragmites australis]|uniref:uncharacterized protein LOC133898510 n=1 Tax=Phragmites australis TaxID=29695 RepID=UPI002D797D99|nr:uncharacterized protein LOC133898510 [Phragmites australis]